MFEGVHDRLLTKLARAGAQSRFLQWNDAQPGGDTCPLTVMVKALARDELDALAAIVDASGTHGPLFWQSSMAPPAPARRLLEPFMYMKRPVTWEARLGPWAQKVIENRFRSVDGEALAALVTAIEDERTRRAG